MPQNKPLTSRLAAHIGTAHIEVQDFMDRQALQATHPIESIIRELIDLANQKPPLHPYQLEHEARKVLDKLPNALGKSAYESLLKIGEKSAEAVVVALVKAVPMKYMPMEVLTQEAVGGAIIKAVMRVFKTKEPAVKLDKVELKRRFHNLLIEPIKRHVLEKIVLGGAKAISRMMQAVKQAISPKKIADILIKGLSGGKDRRQQVADLRSELGMTKATAMRTVRTEGARVSTESNKAAFDELGDAILGYMIHATPNPDSRWWHRHRSGTIYWKEPKEGQKGLEQLPNPPMEAKDPKERPEGAPDQAFNCLCYQSPVFRPLDDLDGTLAHIGHTADHKIVPDILVYNDWYKQTDERLKRRAVGSRRYDLVTKKHGKDAGYYHFINPETGELLPLEDLARETPEQTMKRIYAAREFSDQQRKARRDILLFGSVQP